MTIALSYLDDLSRVRIELSGMPDGTVQVQRVTNAGATDATWAENVVRGGVALPVEGGIAQLDDFDGWASDVENFYRVVPVDPPAGLLLDGDAGDYASTPDDAALDITGDLDIRAEVTADSWTTAEQGIVAKWTFTGDQRSYLAVVQGDGAMRIWWSPDGTSATQDNLTSNALLPVDSGRIALRWVLDVDDGGNHTARFFYADTIAGGWTQLGTDVTVAGTISIHAGTGGLEVGGWDQGGGSQLAGTIHAVEVRNGIDGTVAADPDFAAQPGGTTGFTDDAGRTWTVNGGAQIIGIETDSITPSLAGEVWLKSIKHPLLNRPLFRVIDRGDNFARPDTGGVMQPRGRNLPVAATDRRSSKRFTLYAQVPDQAAADEVDEILSAGGVMFIHVPPDKPVQGGYVYIATTAQQRPNTLDRFVFELPCTVAAAPAPQVVGTTLTGVTLLTTFNSGSELLAAYATGRDLYDTVGDPSDVTVP